MHVLYYLEESLLDSLLLSSIAREDMTCCSTSDPLLSPPPLLRWEILLCKESNRSVGVDSEWILNLCRADIVADDDDDDDDDGVYDGRGMLIDGI